MTAVLELDRLTKRYPNGVAANDAVSFTLQPGQVVGLLGHNGAGKTTLVRQVSGLLRPTSGTIRLDGCDVGRDPRAARRLCSVQAQAHVPINGLSPRTAVSLVGRMRGGGRAAVETRTAALTERLQLTEWMDRRTRPGAEILSGGVLRLVSFCMAVVVPGRLVVLDEPTNDVDPVRRRLLWAEIRRLADDGHGVLLVTHNVVEAERSVDRVLILHHGRLVTDQTPGALLAEVRGRLRVSVTFEPGADQGRPSSLEEGTVEGRELIGMAAAAELDDVLRWAEVGKRAGRVERFSVTSASLDDAYSQVVASDDEEARARSLARVPA